MQDVYTCAANLEYADLLLLFVFLQPNMRAFAESVKNQPVSGLFRERRICYNGEEIKEGKAGMKQICFTAEWGTWTGYFAEKYLARYDFSGHLETEGGTVLRVERIFYPKDAWGPFIFSKQFIEYGKTEWESHLCNCFDGIRVTAEADGKTVFRIVTKMGTAEFTPDTLQKNGHLVFHVGEKYSMAIIHIEPAEPAWRAAPLLPGEVRVPGSAFSGRQADFFGVRGVAVPPGGMESACFRMSFPQARCETDRISVQCFLRFLISESPEKEKKARGLPNFLLKVNGKEIYRNATFTTYHDTNSQFLEEVPFELPVECFISGENRVELDNLDEKFTVLVPMVRFVPEIHHHMEIVSCPKWAVVGRPFCIIVRCAAGAARLRVDYDPLLFEPAMPETDVSSRHLMYRGKMYPIPDNEEFFGAGEHEFYFRAKQPSRKGAIRFTDTWSGAYGEAVIGECWATAGEDVPSKVGVEIKTGTPWQYRYLVRKILREQLGNLVVFRDYHNRFTGWQELWEAAADCRKYGFYTDAISMKDQEIIASASAERCQCAGGHECTGIFYGAREPENLSRTMRDAETASINLLRTVAEGYRIPGVPVATGDASGGSREAYLAGFDVLRHETFVAHNLLVLPNARGCAKAFHKKIWGAHIATQHNAQPELDDGLRRYWLGFALAWVTGANFLFEEDSMFLCFKYYRMVGDDYLPRRKRELCAEFYKYTQTHPRPGRPRVNIAVVQGRYAPPFNGISTTNYGEPPKDEALKNENFPVWGMAGCRKWEWGWRQPEKGYHLLETLAPGICLNPLNQDSAKVRRFFSGDPKGEFDFLPVEADGETFADYRLMLLLAWHTMEPNTEQQGKDYCNDYEKFLHYAEGGGTLFLSVPHLTTRSDREFLLTMDDLRLIYGGDVSDLCGVRVLGKSKTVFSGASGRGSLTGVDLMRRQSLIRRPNVRADEDGPCCLADVELCGAETVVADTASGKPLIVRNRVGKGFVYLLCTYAYPGHEALRDFMPNFLDELITRYVPRSVSVEDPSGDVYWSVWKSSPQGGKLYLLNTDWTSSGNTREVAVHAGGSRFPFAVREGEVEEVAFSECAALSCNTASACLTPCADGTFLLDGFGKTELMVSSSGGCTVTVGGKSAGLCSSAGQFRIPVDFDKLGNHLSVAISSQD